MSDPQVVRVVFDCTVFAQALINPRGPAGACVLAAQTKKIKLFVSEYVLGEIRELPLKIPPSLRVTPDRVQNLLDDLAKYAEPAENVPSLFAYPRDPDDAPYVDLAIATSSRLLVSRDKDLLDLMDISTDSGKEFRSRFPGIVITDPPSFLRELNAIE